MFVTRHGRCGFMRSLERFLGRCCFNKIGNYSYTSQAATSLQQTCEATTTDADRFMVAIQSDIMRTNHIGEKMTGYEDCANVNWDELGFVLIPTDYMYIMKCSRDEKFSSGKLNRYGNIELSPSSGVLNYGQGIFEGLKAYRKEDGRLLLFRPEENARRMQMGAERMCMPSPSTHQFLHAVKQTVLANRRWVPPPGKGSLYVRPLLIGTGPVLGLAPAPDYTFLTYASPVGNYFKIGNYSYTSQAATSLQQTCEATTTDADRFMVAIQSDIMRTNHIGEKMTGYEDCANVNWDELGFVLIPTDYMYIMKCSRDEKFSSGKLNRYGNIELSPSSGVLNYGQGIFEGLKAYRKEDGRLLLFRPEENARRMQMGAERMCMPSPSTHQFLHAVKQTVLANRRWVPPPGKGSLYVRPLLIGTGPVLGLAPAPDYTFLTYASPVGNYFKIGNYSYTSQAATSLQQTCEATTTDADRFMVAIQSDIMRTNHIGEKMTGYEDCANVNWDELGFVLIPTDYMYIMKCSRDEKFSSGKLNRYGNIELSPSSGVLNYGQGIFEGLKAYRKEDGRLLLFRPEENARRMQMGAERMCMPSPSTHQFLHAVKQTVLANRRWVPPPGKGSLYVRPLLIGTGPVLGLAPAPDYTFLTYASPVGNYFKEGLSPLNLFVDDDYHRASPGGTGGVKTIGNYAPVFKAQTQAKKKGFSDVIFLDSVNKRFLEEASSCNIFIIKDNVISTPSTQGTILAGITRKSIIEIALKYDYQVKERPVPVEELLNADEVFCTGTAVVVAPVGSVTYHGKRVEYRSGVQTVSHRLYSALTSIQMGLVDDTMGWTVEID